MSNSSSNGKNWCTILSVCAFTIGTTVCMAFDRPTVALTILYGTVLGINTLIIENT